MNKTPINSKLAFALAVLALALSFLGGTQGQAAQTKAVTLTHKQLLWLVTHAKTTADHEKLATYYRQQAQHYLQQAKEHEQMAASYPQLNASKHPGAPNLASVHCKDWAELETKEAEDAQALAAIHGEMAKEAAVKK